MMTQQDILNILNQMASGYQISLVTPLEEKGETLDVTITSMIFDGVMLTTIAITPNEVSIKDLAGIVAIVHAPSSGREIKRLELTNGICVFKLSPLVVGSLEFVATATERN